MRNFEFCTPTRVIFGKDTQKKTGELIRKYGFKKVLIHYGGGSVIRSGLLDQVTASLKEEGIEYVTLGGVQPNPTLSLAKEGIKLCLEEGVDFILAVGGGSVIDSAKCIADGVANPDIDVWKFFTREEKLKKALPQGNILTLSASGSEMSNSCVITNEDGGLKRGLSSQLHRPLFAICNPELTYTVSKYQTACGSVDIMMHTLERYLGADKDTPLTDRIAEGLLKTVAEAGKIADQVPVHDGETRKILDYDVTFFDIHSTKAKQYGFTTVLKNGQKLTCAGDEPYNSECESYVAGSKWLLHEAFCLYEDRERFKPYEKHHSTVKDACELADKMEIGNLILWHTEDKTIQTRKERYLQEGHSCYQGNLFVPDDGEIIDFI